MILCRCRLLCSEEDYSILKGLFRPGSKQLNKQMETSAKVKGNSSAPREAQSPTAMDDTAAEASTSGRSEEFADTSADASAAIMVQRIYRGHRERRRLADIALLEQEKGW